MDETQLAYEGWKIMSGFGVLGVVGFIFLAPLAYLMFRTAGAISRHGEGLAKKAHIVLDNAIKTAPIVAQSMAENTKQTAELAVAISGVKDSHRGLVAKLEPFADHPERNEEVMLQIAAVLEAKNRNESDPEVKRIVSDSVKRMREVLTRKIGSRN